MNKWRSLDTDNTFRKIDYFVVFCEKHRGHLPSFRGYFPLMRQWAKSDKIVWPYKGIFTPAPTYNYRQIFSFSPQFAKLILLSCMYAHINAFSIPNGLCEAYYVSTLSFIFSLWWRKSAPRTTLITFYRLLPFQNQSCDELPEPAMDEEPPGAFNHALQAELLPL